MLCLGSHRKPSTFRTELDTNLFPVCTPSNPAEGRDLRIRLMAEIFNATAQGTNIRLDQYADLELACVALNEALEELDGLLRVVLPLSGMPSADHLQFTVNSQYATQ